MKSMKDKKGISLVALVVTIIIMLLLVAVTLSFSVGKNGIINKAKGLGKAQSNAEMIEGVKRFLLGKYMEFTRKDYPFEIKTIITDEDFVNAYDMRDGKVIDKKTKGEMSEDELFNLIQKIKGGESLDFVNEEPKDTTEPVAPPTVNPSPKPSVPKPRPTTNITEVAVVRKMEEVILSVLQPAYNAKTKYLGEETRLRLARIEILDSANSKLISELESKFSMDEKEVIRRKYGAKHLTNKLIEAVKKSSERAKEEISVQTKSSLPSGFIQYEFEGQTVDSLTLNDDMFSTAVRPVVKATVKYRRIIRDEVGKPVQPNPPLLER